MIGGGTREVSGICNYGTASALVAEERLEVLSSKMSELAEPEPCGRKWRAVVGESQLREVEVPLCCPKVQSGEVCCGAESWDNVKIVLSLVWTLDFYSMLLFHVDTNSTSRGDMGCIKHNYVAVGWGKDLGSQVVSPQSYWWEGRAWGMDESCRSTLNCTAGTENGELTFMTLMCPLFEDKELLGRDEIHVKKWSKSCVSAMPRRIHDCFRSAAVMQEIQSSDLCLADAGSRTVSRSDGWEMTTHDQVRNWWTRHSCHRV